MRWLLTVLDGRTNTKVTSYMLIKITAILNTFGFKYIWKFVYIRFHSFFRSFSFVFRNFCVRRGGGRHRPARDGAVRLRATAATNAKIENEGKEGVRTPGRPDV